MKTLRAFTLRDDLEDEFDGGSVTLSDGTSIDLARRLAEGNGVIVTDSEREADALAGHPDLVRAPAPEVAQGLDALTIPQLREAIAKLNETREDADKVEVPSNATKPQIIAILEADAVNNS